MYYIVKVTSEPVIKALFQTAKERGIEVCRRYQDEWKDWPYFVLNSSNKKS